MVKPWLVEQVIQRDEAVLVIAADCMAAAIGSETLLSWLDRMARVIATGYTNIAITYGAQ